MDVTAENLANAETTVGPNGGPYQRQEIVLQSVSTTSRSSLASAIGAPTSPSSTPGGVEVAGVVTDATSDQLIYDPGNPQANKQGYVKEPNVQPVTEMVDLIDESNSYQADMTAMQTAKTMYTSALGCSSDPSDRTGPLGASEWSIGGSASAASVAGAAQATAAPGCRAAQFRRCTHERGHSLESTQDARVTDSSAARYGAIERLRRGDHRCRNASLSLDFAAGVRDQLDQAATTLFQTQMQPRSRPLRLPHPLPR